MHTKDWMIVNKTNDIRTLLDRTKIVLYSIALIAAICAIVCTIKSDFDMLMVALLADVSCIIGALVIKLVVHSFSMKERQIEQMNELISLVETTTSLNASKTSQ